MGPPDPKDVARDTARDLSQLASDLNRTKGDATHWLKGVEYATLLHRLEGAQRRSWWRRVFGGRS